MVSNSPNQDYPIQSISFVKVQITDDFWSYRFKTHREITLPYVFRKCERTKRIDNFSRAAGLMENKKTSKYPYDDSDVFKIIEGAAYSLNVKRDKQFETYVDDIIDKVAAAQEEDGYLYTHRSINPKNPSAMAGKERWEYVSLTSHELYNVGHLYESAVAYYEATGKRKLLDVALKNANLINKTFGPGKMESPPGHQEIEMGLVRLYRATKNKDFLKLAKFFLDIRGKKDRIGYEKYHNFMNNPSFILPLSGKDKLQYNQTHARVIEQEEAVGHAVRGVYMYSGMADVAALTGDKDYLQALNHIWENVVSKKLYITGGIGSEIEGEAFGNEYELPNFDAYNETCAAIANVFWNHRMFLLHGDAKYIDVLERTLYNGLISGYSFEGNKFFYLNPLASKGNHARSRWFVTACCPTNIARFIPSISRYVYAQKDNTIFINLFISSSTSVSIMGKNLTLTQETEYPWEGTVKIKVNLNESGNFIIAIRIPGWTNNKPVPSDLYRYLNNNNDRLNIQVNDEVVKMDIKKGYGHIDRSWTDGDVIELEIPMPIRRVLAHDKVKNNAGKVALERGPIVYCLEWPDNDLDSLFDLTIDDNAILTHEYRKDLLNGLVVIKGIGKCLKKFENEKSAEKTEKEFVAIPYYAWAHRGKGEMMVWIDRNLKIISSPLL
jgi:DUF1680 family protein